MRGRLPTDPARNTAGAAVQALLSRLETTRGVSLTIQKGLPLASGIGSSGASAVAAVVAVNELLGRPASMELAVGVRDGGRAGRVRCHASRQRRSLALRRFHPRAERESPGYCSPASAGRARVRGPSSSHRGPYRHGARAVGRGREVAGCRQAMGQPGRAGRVVVQRRPRVAVALARRRDRRAQACSARAGFLRSQGCCAGGRRARVQHFGFRTVGVRASELARGGQTGRCRDAACFQRRERRSAPTCGCRWWAARVRG